MRITHTIRFLTMDRLGRAGIVRELREAGMVLTDECLTVPPCSLMWDDNINGAGTRTFIWNDGGVTDTERLRNFPDMRGTNSSAYWTVSPAKSVEIEIYPVIETRTLRLED